MLELLGLFLLAPLMMGLGGSSSDEAVETGSFGELEDNPEATGETIPLSVRDLDTESDPLYGEEQGDLINGDYGNDSFFGSDRVSIGGEGDDIIQGDAGAEILAGENGADRIEGGGGDDFIHGGDGLDTIDGGAGADFIFGGSGADILSGGIGNDVLTGGTGADVINGGEGDDIIFSGTLGPRDLTLAEWFEFSASESAPDGFGDAYPPDDGARDTVFGGAGSDSMFLGGGDEATGGDGDDIFVLLAERAGDPVIITDYNDGDDELLIEASATGPAVVMNPVQVGSDIEYRNTEGDTVVILRNQDLATFNPAGVTTLRV